MKRLRDLERMADPKGGGSSNERAMAERLATKARAKVIEFGGDPGVKRAKGYGRRAKDYSGPSFSTFAEEKAFAVAHILRAAKVEGLGTKFSLDEVDEDPAGGWVVFSFTPRTGNRDMDFDVANFLLAEIEARLPREFHRGLRHGMMEAELGFGDKGKPDYGTFYPSFGYFPRYGSW